MTSGAVAICLEDYILEEGLKNAASIRVHNIYDSALNQFDEDWQSQSLINTPPIEIMQPDAQMVLSTAFELHDSGKFLEAADVMLNFIVDQLDAGDMHAINEMLRLQTRNLLERPEYYGSRGLARVHNLLALTYRHDANLASRSSLRSAYQTTVAASEGEAAARNAVANL